MKIKFFDYFIFNDTKKNIINDIFFKALSSDSATKSCRTLFCLNPHSFVVSLKDEIFFNALKSADWLIPDGVGIVMASGLIGNSRIKNRITGADIFFGISSKMNSDSSLRVFFLGSTEHVLNSICNKFQSDYPNIYIAGLYSPPFMPSYSEDEIDYIITLVNQSNADVLWVGLTAPKQEKFIFLNRKKFNVKFVGAIGAVFDFYAGTVLRAPPIMQRCGLEWLYRLCREPVRLAKRNFISTPIFVFICLKEFIFTLFKKFHT